MGSFQVMFEEQISSHICIRLNLLAEKSMILLTNQYGLAYAATSMWSQ